jgi:hypothetical protein
VLWNRYGSPQKYESASKHPVIHIFVEFHNVLDCELEDFLLCYGGVMEANKNMNQPRSTP